MKEIACKTSTLEKEGVNRINVENVNVNAL